MTVDELIELCNDLPVYVEGDNDGIWIGVGYYPQDGEDMSLYSADPLIWHWWGSDEITVLWITGLSDDNYCVDDHSKKKTYKLADYTKLQFEHDINRIVPFYKRWLSKYRRMHGKK